jgi:hypothetical protein
MAEEAEDEEDEDEVVGFFRAELTDEVCFDGVAGFSGAGVFDVVAVATLLAGLVSIDTVVFGSTAIA